MSESQSVGSDFDALDALWDYGSDTSTFPLNPGDERILFSEQETSMDIVSDDPVQADISADSSCPPAKGIVDISDAPRKESKPDSKSMLDEMMDEVVEEIQSMRIPTKYELPPVRRSSDCEFIVAFLSS
jgi:hypothetical protein